MAVPGISKPSSGDTTSHHLLVFTGPDAASVTQTAEHVSSYAEAHPDRLPDIAHTLASKAAQSQEQTHRAYAVAENGSTSLPLPLSPVLQTPARKQTISFVFTGQGAQWAGMGAELLTSYASFRKDVREMDRVLQQLPHPPLWTVEGWYILLAHIVRGNDLVP
jgi:acyl transferase domain-containing protein